MKTNWTLKVTEELNDKTFEAAHKLKISKSEFIRQAVEEKIHPLIESPKEKAFSVADELKDEKDWPKFNPQPKKNSISNP